jgi:hypothetical protein
MTDKGKFNADKPIAVLAGEDGVARAMTEHWCSCAGRRTWSGSAPGYGSVPGEHHQSVCDTQTGTASRFPWGKGEAFEAQDYGPIAVRG